jgi:hypothetical protein
MGPRLIVVVTPGGLESIRMVCRDIGHPDPAFDLYRRSKKLLKELDRTLKHSVNTEEKATRPAEEGR